MDLNKSTPSYLFVYAGHRGAREDAVRNGQSASDFFYGFFELEKIGMSVQFIDVLEETQQSLVARLLNRLHSIFKILPYRVTGDLIICLNKFRHLINNHDLVIATTSGLGMTLEIFRFLHLINVTVITQQVGLTNHNYNPIARWCMGNLLKRGKSFVPGGNEGEILANFYGSTKDWLVENQYGVDLTFWTPNKIKWDKGYILSVGTDGRRDYELLIEAATHIEWQVKIVARVKPEKRLGNVEFIGGGIFSSNGLTDIELRRLYREASLVVIPLKQTNQPSGQSVALQAMACGTPVVITEINGLWNRDVLKNKENICLVPVGDLPCLVETINDLMTNVEKRALIGSNGQVIAQKYGNIEQFAQRLNNTVKQYIK